MHNNFYFLRQLSAVLGTRLHGAVISECFSQSKDELIVRFEIGRDSFFLRASLLPELNCLSFPPDFQRARRNSIDLFPLIGGRQVIGTTQFNNERSFSIDLSDGLRLIFKMHGNRTNILVADHDRVVEIFRKKLSHDLAVVPEKLHREIDWSREYFMDNRGNLKAAYFTFGKVVWRYLEEHQFEQKSVDEQWRFFETVLSKLEHPKYHVTRIEGKPTLSLLEVGQISETHHDPLTALNAFYHAYVHDYAFEKEKRVLLTMLNSRLESGRNYCEKNARRLKEINQNSRYRQWADLIMANLHAIRPGAESVVLENFYENQRPEEIPLKKELSPQKNAEQFYRKAKNQHIEVEKLTASIQLKQKEMADLERRIEEVEAAPNLRALRAIHAELRPNLLSRDAGTLPFYEFHHEGYRILVGKNAQSNDILTFRHGYKNDLWLHAKDVTGSHVLIKHQAGKNFPKPVIEFAASLAAFNSRRKHESLCPVIVTPRKYVRKRKGDPPGAVVVERETVVMAKPRLEE